MCGKADLRKQLMEREAGFSKKYIAESNAGITRNIFSIKEFQNAGTVLFFYCIGGEPDTREMMLRAFELKKIVVLPKTYPKGVMVARIIRRFEELMPSRFGIPEPTESAPVIRPDELDFIVVPATALDREGYRLGRGAGYYDRYLSSTSAFTCGVVRENMLVPRVPREKHDIRMSCVVTENEILRFDPDIS